MKAIKVRIYPKKWQKVLIEKHFGCCRFAFNFGLNLKTQLYTEEKKSISIFDIQKEIPKLYEEKPWLKEVSSQAIQQSLKDLDSAFSHFFKKNNDFPNFKSRKNEKQSFRVPQGFKIERSKKHIKLPKIKWIRFKDKFNVPEDAVFRNITVSREGNEYYASICYLEDIENTEKPEKQKIEESKTLGIDLGVRDLVALSNGDKIKNPKHIKKYEEKLSIEQRKLSSKTKDSNSYKKQKEKVRKVHKKIRNVRKDFLHKLTKSIIENQDYTSYAIEDLSIQKMQKDNDAPMAKAIGDAAWGTFRYMMEYKTEDIGKNLLIIGRFEPSSKTCSCCGHIYHELRRDEKEWVCKKCNVKHDRDTNASINIKNFGLIKSLGKDFSLAY